MKNLVHNCLYILQQINRNAKCVNPVPRISAMTYEGTNDVIRSYRKVRVISHRYKCVLLIGCKVVKMCDVSCMYEMIRQELHCVLLCS
jgi:hypothetical protein